MPRPRIDLIPHIPDIRQWIEQDQADRQEVQQRLQQRFGIECSITTLKRTLQTHEIRIQARPQGLEQTAELRIAITNIFRRLNLTDEHTARILRLDGFEVSARWISKRRRELGLYKRMPAELHAELKAEMEVILQQELDAGHVEDFGYRHMYGHMRKKLNIVGRDRLYAVWRNVNKEGLERRQKEAKTHRGAVILPGPNYSFSLDAYCKMERFGFQIYGIIDAYSRYMVSLYIGIHARTQKSVLRQYVDTIAETGELPQMLRTDRGAETTQAAGVHYYLSSQLRRRVDGEPLQLSDCYHFGTSKENQRIEAWWQQQSRATLNRWRDYFAQLVDMRTYSPSRADHRIAFLAIYIPIIRLELDEFTHWWNEHKIRSQKKRPHVVSGIPYLLYNYPQDSGGYDCGVPIDRALLQPILDMLDDVDIETFLPPLTQQWCVESLAAMGFTNPVDGRTSLEDGSRVHYHAFVALRDATVTHMQSQAEPLLTEVDDDIDVLDRLLNNDAGDFYEQLRALNQAANDRGYRLEAVDDEDDRIPA